MSVSTTATRVSFSGNGSTTAFAFPYEYRATADLKVVLVSSANVATLKTLTTHYTVSGVSDSHGGYSSATVTMVTAPASGETLVIYRSPSPVQATDVESESDPLYALNNALDLATYLVQALYNDALKLPIGVTESFSNVLPDLPDDDGYVYYLAPNSARTALAWTALSTGTVAVSSAMTAVVTAASLAAARTAMGLAIATDVQAYSARLTDIAALTPTDSNFIVGNGTTWVAESGSTARTSLGVAIGTDVQAYSERLAEIAALAVTDSNIIVGNGTAWVAESGATARTSLGVGTGDSPTFQSATLSKAANPRLTISHTGATASTLLMGADSGSAFIGTSTNGPFSLYTNNTEKVKIFTTGGVNIGSPTGGDKGSGTLNAVAVYDDNTLLTCYVFDAALDGKVDLGKWDALTPDRFWPEQVAMLETGEADEKGNPILAPVLVEEARLETRIHEPLRKFAARLGTDTDPLDLDKYVAHWRTKRHLTSLPNEAKYDPTNGLSAGEWVQRLIETVEIQAVHIAQLHERLKALGG